MSGRLVLLLLAILVAGGLATLASLDPGYVMVIWRNTSVETSLWVALILILVAVLVLRWLLVLMMLVLSGPAGWRSWRNKRRFARYCADEAEGQRALLEGRWKVAQKRLQAAANRADRPVTALLGAARAANALGEAKQRDRLLDAAREAAPELDLGVELLRAELLLAAGDLDGARRLLETLGATDARNHRRLQLLADVLVAEGDGEALKALLPELEKQKVAGSEQLQRWRRLAEAAQPPAAPAVAQDADEALQEDSESGKQPPSR